jgi:uroporphyrinogen-III decarboxylase
MEGIDKKMSGNLIKQTYNMENTSIPVLAVRKSEKSPNNYSVRDIVFDPKKMFHHQIYNIEQTELYGSDWVSYLKPWHGVGIYADAFGSETTWPDDDYPWTEPFIEEITEVYQLKMPKAGDSPLMEKVLETIRLFNEWSGRNIPISLTDTQSPFNTASLIVRTEVLLTACYDNPAAVHHLLSMITDLLIDFSKMQMEAIGNKVALPGHIFPAGAERGISISDDNNSMISPEMYEEFILPYMNRISHALGGLYVHSCGNFIRNLPSWKKIEGLLGVNMHIGAGDMDPNTTKETVGGSCSLWADVGIKWHQVKDNIEDFYTDHYLPGLLSGGDSRGLMVEAPKADDPVEQKEKVDWTREKISQGV